MKDISREDWVGLYRKYVRTPGPRRAEECIGLDEMIAFFKPQTSRRIKYRLLRHILDCETCRNEFEWLHELNLRTADFGKNVEKLEREPRSRLPLRGWAWAGVGTAAALLFFLFIVPAHRKHLPPEPVYRGSLQRQFRDVAPPQGADVSRIDLNFGWRTPIAGGTFVFEIFDPAMALLWRSPAIPQTQIRIPDEILRGMKDGRVYYWSVSGTWEDQPIIESPFYSFRLIR